MFLFDMSHARTKISVTSTYKTTDKKIPGEQPLHVNALKGHFRLSKVDKMNKLYTFDTFVLYIREYL